MQRGSLASSPPLPRPPPPAPPRSLSLSVHSPPSSRVLLDRWTLLGVPSLMFAVAAMLGGIAALLAGLTLMGVALLLGPVTACWELSPRVPP